MRDKMSFLDKIVPGIMCFFLKNLLALSFFSYLSFSFSIFYYLSTVLRSRSFCLIIMIYFFIFFMVIFFIWLNCIKSLSFISYFNLVSNISIMLTWSLTFQYHTNLIHVIISWTEITKVANG